MHNGDKLCGFSKGKPNPTQKAPVMKKKPQTIKNKKSNLKKYGR